ncbi:MAG TPA: glycosyltransferase family A protein [Anaerolineales bacterium]
MSFLTIFTAPKPFTNPHIATIQRNAIQSWRHLGQDVEVILVGNERGMAETAAELGVAHLPEVVCNEKGTPLVSSIFQLARQASNSPLLAYLNADILVLPDFVETARGVLAQADKFLVVGQRWDLDVTQELDFSPGWDERLRTDVKRRGSLHAPAGSDYFIFPRDLYSDMPDFAIGRAGWDNWMIYRARQQGWPAIDATPSLVVIHQSHDYSHLPGGLPHYNLDESQHNMALAGGPHHMYSVLDTDRQLIGGQIRRPRSSLLRSIRQVEMWLTPPDGRRQGPRWAVARQVRRLRRRISGSL